MKRLGMLLLVFTSLLYAGDTQEWFSYFLKPLPPAQKVAPKLMVAKPGAILDSTTFIMDSSGHWVFKPNAVVVMSCFQYIDKKFVPGVFAGMGAGLTYERQISIKGNVTTFSLQINVLEWGAKLDSIQASKAKYGPMVGISAFDGWGVGVAKDVSISGWEDGYYVLFSYSSAFGKNKFPF